MEMYNGWPMWAMQLFGGLSVGLGGIGGVRRIMSSVEIEKPSEKKTGDGREEKKQLFRSLQMEYLSVYLIIMLADWLQGTNMYTLYSSYGQSVSTLFLTGFSSALLFGTYAGSFVDAYGRKKACIIFCVLEIMINTMEHVNNIWILLFGRILGGISTSLLFTAFESWMVSEHRRRGFPDDWLASTFSLAAFGNGCVAVLAGIVAQFASDLAGDIGPFQLAILLTVIALLIISVYWPENIVVSRGRNRKKDATTELQETSVSFTREAMHAIYTQSKIAGLCAVTALYEGATFTFVFLWVPTLLKHDPNLPTGLVFASLMLCIAAGGELFGLALSDFHFSLSCITITSLCLAAFAAFIAAYFSYSHFGLTLFAFCLIETCVGTLQACASALRAHLLPDHLQSSVNNIGRIPLNLLVVAGTLIADHTETHFAFFAVSSTFALAALLHLFTIGASSSSLALDQHQGDKKAN